MKNLIAIQQELKAPKGQYNSFGKYKYRSCEDILEAVKPLLVEHGCLLTITDTLEQLGERYYVKATATICTPDGSYSVSAYAREADAKKGMDESQVTGTASSYARKYALNGLFLIDDTKDADTDENTAMRQDAPMATEKQINFLKKLGRDSDENAAYIKERVKAWDQLTMHDATEIIGALKK